MKKKAYRTLNSYYREIFGTRVHKVPLDAGLGCPNRTGTRGCIYCNERGSGTGQLAEGVGVPSQLAAGSTAVRGKFGSATKLIAYFQSYTNTNAPADRLREIWSAVDGCDGVVGIAVGTRPDCLTAEHLDVLAEFAGRYRIFLELGLQSIRDDVLAWMGRGHDVDRFRQAVDLAKRYPVEIITHVILGCAGESRDDAAGTGAYLSRLGVDGVKIHLLYVAKGTPLETEYRNGRFSPIEGDEYAARVCDLIEHLRPEIVIHRVTGDAHRGELVAPAWSARKNDVMASIDAEFERRGTCQGVRWTSR